MNILTLMAKATLDGRQFKAGVKELEHAADHFAKDNLKYVKRAIIEAFSIGAIVEFTRHVIESAERVNHLSEQFDVSTDEVQKVDFAAKKVGLTFEDWANALIKIGKARKEAGTNQDIRSVFERFGQGWDRVNDSAITNEQILKDILRNYSEMEKTSRTRAEFDELAGRKAERLLAMYERMNELPPTMMSKDDLDRVKEALIAWQGIEQSVTASAIQTVRLIPATQAFAKWLAHGGFGKGSTLRDYMEYEMEKQQQLLTNRKIAATWNPESYGFKVDVDEPGGKLKKGSPQGPDTIGMNRETQRLLARVALEKTILALEMERLHHGDKRAILEAEITKLMAQQKGFREGDRIWMEAQAEINKRKLEIQQMDSSRGIGVDNFQKIGAYTGGTAGRMAYYGAIGAGSTPSEIARAHLVVSKESNGVLKQIRDQRAAAREQLGH